MAPVRFVQGSRSLLIVGKGFVKSSLFFIYGRTLPVKAQVQDHVFVKINALVSLGLLVE